MNLQWIEKPHNEDFVEYLEDQGYHPVVSRVLSARGLQRPGEVSDFFNLSLRTLHDPFLLPNAQKAVDRLSSAIDSGEEVFVWGDYDVDGITSTALIVSALKKFGAKVQYHVPHRQKDGYDVKVESIDRVVASGARLLVTVDCGIVAFAAATAAKKAGLDMIVTDHHTPSADGRLPECLAVVNPRIAGSQYPFKELAGVGIAFKLMCALASHRGYPVKQMVKDTIEYVALGTVADMAVMNGENRAMVHYGCLALNNTNKPGVKALMKVSRTNKLDSTNIGFTLGPRINAVGRLGDPKSALELLLTDSQIESTLLAQDLESANLERQKIQAHAFDSAVKYLEDNDIDPAKDGCIVIASAKWPAGVVGLLAGKLAERYSVPTLVAQIKDDGYAKGSCRSAQGIDILDALKSKDCLTMFRKKGDSYVVGGHAFAAGFEISTDNISDVDRLKKSLSDYIRKNYSDMDFSSGIKEYDAPLILSQVNKFTCRAIESLAPFGQGNPMPVFRLQNCLVTELKTTSSDKHLKFLLSSSADGKDSISAMWWQAGPKFEEFSDAQSVDVLATLDIGSYEKYRPSLFLQDIRIRRTKAQGEVANG